MKRLKYFFIISIISLIGFTSCSGGSNTDEEKKYEEKEGPAERLGKKLDAASEELREEFKQMSENLEERMDEANQKLEKEYDEFQDKWDD